MHVDPRMLRLRGLAVHPRCRGSVYLLTLGLAMILTLIGVAAVSAGRVGGRTMTDSQDWEEAQSLAFAGSEHAMTQINRTGNWRTAFNGQTIQKSLGRGTFSWRLADETDNDLSDSTSDPFVILATGTVGRASYSMRVHMSCGGGALTAGVVSNGNVTLTGSSAIDSYDSTNGAYGGSNVGSNATVQTNSTATNAVSLDWSTAIRGSVQVGPGGNPDTVVKETSGSNVTGTTSAMSQAIPMPTLSVPAGMGASTGDLVIRGSQTSTVSGNLHVNNLTVGNSGRMKVSGAVTIVAENDVNLTGSGVIEILAGGSLTIYVKGSTTVTNSGRTVIDGQNLSSIMILSMGTGTVTISGSGGITQGVIVAPNGTVTISNSGQMGGAIVAKQLNILGNARFHEDRRITGQVDRVTIGSSSTPKPDAWGRVVQ